VLPLAIVAGIAGLCQNFVGFLPYQQSWITSVGRVYTLAVCRVFGKGFWLFGVGTPNMPRCWRFRLLWRLPLIWHLAASGYMFGPILACGSSLMRAVGG